ncbi:hypothetical protein, partial [Scopulibacillus daqui]|uniref:hypothetical protein n=1 Tax=Scopulibacillus daqui TaxID=1469162 RepID=UPI00196207E7
SKKNRKNIKASGEKQFVFLHLLHFKDLSDKPFILRTYQTSPLKLLIGVNGNFLRLFFLLL